MQKNTASCEGRGRLDTQDRLYPYLNILIGNVDLMRKKATTLRLSRGLHCIADRQGYASHESMRGCQDIVPNPQHDVSWC